MCADQNRASCWAWINHDLLQQTSFILKCHSTDRERNLKSWTSSFSRGRDSLWCHSFSLWTVDINRPVSDSNYFIINFDLFSQFKIFLIVHLLLSHQLWQTSNVTWSALSFFFNLCETAPSSVATVYLHCLRQVQQLKPESDFLGPSLWKQTKDFDSGFCPFIYI